MATYRHDPDLEFLRHCHRDDLDLLVSVLICDPKDGLTRITETLTYDPQYKTQAQPPALLGCHCRRGSDVWGEQLCHAAPLG